jgi:mono/diheme cytochrome c family protein
LKPRNFALVKQRGNDNFAAMKLFSLSAAVLLAAGVFPAFAQAPDGVASAPQYVPDMTHANDALPDGVLAWDELSKATDAAFGQPNASFIFSFTNVTDKQVVIIDVHPSCGCTTVELPSRPWLIPAGSNGVIKINVNLAGKAGVIPKSITVMTDKGKKDLWVRITIAPPPPPRVLTEAERAAAMASAKADRQAIFKGDCASCHWKPEFAMQFGEQLYHSACGVCHEAVQRASMVPDLANLKVPTNEEFWRTWASLGKPGSLMPSFAQSQGGPMNEQQIASIAMYLNTVHPSHATNAVGQ